MSIFRRISKLLGVWTEKAEPEKSKPEKAKSEEAQTNEITRELMYVPDDRREEFYRLYDKMTRSKKKLHAYRFWKYAFDGLPAITEEYRAELDISSYTAPALWITRIADSLEPRPEEMAKEQAAQKPTTRILSSPDEQSDDQMAFEATFIAPEGVLKKTDGWLAGESNIAHASDGQVPDDFDPQAPGVLSLYIKDQGITVESLTDPRLQYGLFPKQTIVTSDVTELNRLDYQRVSEMSTATQELMESVAQVKSTRLHRVTITGADDSTSIPWLLTTSEKYPFVEWGILVSRTSTGGFRFPSLRWIDDLQKAIRESDVSPQLSMHICGNYVLDICRGDWESLEADLAKYLEMFDRIQLNFHSYSHLWEEAGKDVLSQKAEQYAWQVILQADGVNESLIGEIQRDGNTDVVPLFDRSGGAGVLPSEWPQATRGFCGYAGGLGPDNILKQLDLIARQAINSDIWVDMERQVRSADNSILAANKVESVLAQVASSPYFVTM